ncbi:MAG: hypothetical protein PF484_09635 [Bacteroidales bacterium]|nr:hypothetical protein [Bacteroidales bacterium]
MFCFKQLEKIIFWWKAKNAHGLHSPFVFNFYNTIKKQWRSNKLPSDKPNGFSKKESSIILAIIQYFKPNRVLLLSGAEQIQSGLLSFISNDVIVLEKNINNLSADALKFDLIIISNLLIISEKKLFNKLSHLVNSESVVIIPHIHASMVSIKRWKTMIKENHIRVSIDMFFIGILLFRSESTKQDFQLRF